MKHVVHASLGSLQEEEWVCWEDKFGGTEGQKGIGKEEEEERMEEAIVLYPSMGIGHILSMVQLAKQLLHHSSSSSAGGNRFKITVLLTTGLMDHPSIDSYIHRISSSHPSISFLRFPFLASTPSVSFVSTCCKFLADNAPNVASALTRISQTSSIKAFVIDLFCTSAMSAASDLGIPVYYFFTSGAAVLSLYSYYPTIHNWISGDRSLKDMKDVELQIPGNAPLSACNMPEPLLDRKDPGYWDMLDFCTHLPKSKGILVNSFAELEPNAVDAIRNFLCFPDPTQRPTVYYVGPLIADPEVQQPLVSLHPCLSWLEKQPSRSVVYLCFGSRGTFSEEQLKEIADGLDKSGQRFLWVVKRPTTSAHKQDGKVHEASEFDPCSVLPSGFIERTKERGLVVASWAPQVEVLSRESVGCFVTHCGWNSILEAVVAGVPMIAWPLYAEQHVNRNVMVEEIKAAVAVEERDDGFVIGEEVERRVRELMESQRGKEIRETSLKVRDMALAAVGESGSSTTALASLLQEWGR